MGTLTFTRQSGSTADQAEFSMNIGKGTGQLYRGVRGTLAWTAGTYVTGGDVIPLASVGLREIRYILVDPLGLGGGADAFQCGLSFKLGGTPSAPTLRAFDAQSTEVPAATNLVGRGQGFWFLGH